jgi:prepilin-type N-terminal cleavage/methylation domain-containing protein
MRRAVQPIRGFTLIEVLVVLAILVILFGLLIVPMISGLEMSSAGRRAIRLQDTERFAIEQIRRDLADAMYVYPTLRVRTAGLDGILGNADDRAVADTSQIVFVPPARDPGTGQVYEPLRFELVPNRAPPEALNVRYAAMPAVEDVDHDPSNGYQGPHYTEDNPFVLYRMEGAYNYMTGAFWDDRNGNGQWDTGEPEYMARTALTPTEGFDVGVTQTVCTTCGAVFPGYEVQYVPGPSTPNDDTRVCPSCGSPHLVYLHRGITITGRRASGETLQPSPDGLVYRSLQSHWDGYQGITQANDPRVASDPAHFIVGRPHVLDATDSVGAAADTDPRILVYAYTPSATPDPRQAVPSALVYDSSAVDAPRDADLGLAYDGPKGQVRFGMSDVVGLNGDEVPPPHTSGQLGTLSILRVAGVPPKPYAFRLTPPQDVSAPILPTKVVLSSIRVWVADPSCGRDADSDGWVDPCVEYKRTTDMSPDDIGAREFWAGVDPYTGDAEIRFNRFRFDDTVNPLRRFVGVDVFYLYRRNFFRDLPPGGDPTRGVHEFDDVVKVDYTTRSELDVSMTLAIVKTADGTELTPQPTQILDKATMTSVVQVKNLDR